MAHSLARLNLPLRTPLMCSAILHLHITHLTIILSLSSKKPSDAGGGGSSQGHLMRAGGVCDVNSLTGLIPPVRPNDQTLADLEDSQGPS